jgi:restriction system protein
VQSLTVFTALADQVALTEAERIEPLPSRRQPVFHNRIGWAHDRLKRAGLSVSARRGLWRVTDAGLAFLRDRSESLASHEIEALARVPRNSELGQSGPRAGEREVLGPSPPPPATATPGERIDAAIAEINESVASELLDLIGAAPPAFFETLVLDLLHSMGYGASRSDVVRVGGSGDGGIDGIISLDRLGLEKVYVQAKRWQNNVGRPEIQGFYGALAGRRAQKGVFITTSAFTREAREFAETVADRLVLLDGGHLARLMIEYGVGVSRKAITVAQVDSDYFEGE